MIRTLIVFVLVSLTCNVVVNILIERRVEALHEQDNIP